MDTLMKKELLSEQRKPLLNCKNITISDIRQKAVVQAVARPHAEAFYDDAPINRCRGRRYFVA